MTLQRPVPLPGESIVPCGSPPEYGLIPLPPGWRLGGPGDDVGGVAETEAWTGAVPPLETDGGSPNGPGLLLPALVLAFTGAGLIALRWTRRRRRRRPRRDRQRPGTNPDSGSVEADDLVDEDRVDEDGARDGTPDPAGHPDAAPAPIRTPTRRPAGKPLVVTLGRPSSRPATTPVRLPPHVAAALSRKRSDEPKPPPEEEPPSPSPEPRRTPTGKSWLVDD